MGGSVPGAAVGMAKTGTIDIRRLSPREIICQRVMWLQGLGLSAPVSLQVRVDEVY